MNKEIFMDGKDLHPTKMERLTKRKEWLAGQLAEVEKAITYLEANPNFEAFQNQMNQVGW